MHSLPSKVPLALAAEDFVANALQDRGWRILSRNFRRVGCEIDIVAAKGTTLVFLEVKFRKYFPNTSQAFEQVITRRKRQSLERGAKCFLLFNEKRLPPWETLRFDLAVVSSTRGVFRLRHYFAGF